jgi:hypothetical protein
MTYEVSVLWFRNAYPGNAVLHWSIFVKENDAEITLGTKHDAMSVPPGIRWAYSSIPNYAVDQSQRYGGSILLGLVEDLSKFESIMKNADLPKLRESCQDWVKRVLKSAVEEGLIDESALKSLEDAPIRPPRSA